MKVNKVTPTHITFTHTYSDNGKMYERTDIVERKYLFNKMSREFATRHGLIKYAA